MYTNGQEWEDRRKWVYESLKGIALKSYISIFIKVKIMLIYFNQVVIILLLTTATHPTKADSYMHMYN